MYKFKSTSFCLIYLYRVYFYRPQRSCGKVMFLHLSVILFPGRHPPRQKPPLGRHPPGRQPLSHHPRQTPPRGRHPQADRQTTPQPPPQADTPPQETATTADGSHPTGMHSCFLFDSGVLAYPLYGIVILLNCPGVIASVERKVGEISLYPAIIIFVYCCIFCVDMSCYPRLHPPF